VSVIIFLVAAAILKMDDVADQSHVDYPAGSIISDILGTIEAGDCQLAAAKLRLTDERWKGFLAGGDSPDRFHNEITRHVIPQNTD
jgi:hypothetical protein